MRDHIQLIPTQHGLAPTRLLSIDEVCEKLRVRRSWTYEHAAELGGRKLFGLLRFDEAALDGWIAEQSLAGQR